MARLLLTITAYPPSTGGAQLLMHQLARHLTPSHAVQVVTQWSTNRTDWLLGTTLNAPREACAYIQEGISVQQITLPTAQRRQLVPWVLGYYLVQGPALKRIARALAAEVEPWAASADLIHNCRSGREGLSYACFNLARRRDIPFVFTPVHHPRWGTWLHRHYHSLYRQADAVIALTEAERTICIRLGAAEERVFVTGMGPVLAEQSNPGRFREKYGLGDSRLVLFLGQKMAYKGAAALLDATAHVWRKAPDVRFAFLGPRTAHSQRLFRSATDARLLELGTVSLQEKTDALAACDVLCVPSMQESFGAVFTEAWSFGKPVIGGDIPAVRQVIEDGMDGLLVAQRGEVIADRLLYLLDRPALRAQMGECGRAKVNARFTWPRLAEQTETVYRHVLGTGVSVRQAQS
jgi:glycosyltransferase involved in cell wall biosynthesis